MKTRKKAAPKKRKLPIAPAKKAERKNAEDLYIDIRTILDRGGNGTAVISGSMLLTKSEDVPMHLFGRLWIMHFDHDGQHYVARPCLIQNDGWIPQKGNRVMFERQPRGVEEEYIFATLVS